MSESISSQQSMAGFLLPEGQSHRSRTYKSDISLPLRTFAPIRVKVQAQGLLQIRFLPSDHGGTSCSAIQRHRRLDDNRRDFAVSADASGPRLWGRFQRHAEGVALEVSCRECRRRRLRLSLVSLLESFTAPSDQHSPLRRRRPASCRPSRPAWRRLPGRPSRRPAWPRCGPAIPASRCRG